MGIDWGALKEGTLKHDIVDRVMRAAIDLPFWELQRPYISEDDRRCAIQFEGTDHVGDFEQSIMAVTPSKGAVAVSSGTAALHLALLAAGVKPGDGVMMPSLTFAASAFAVRYCGAIPHFMDVEPNSLSLSIRSLTESSFRFPAAIMVVHLLGMYAENGLALKRYADGWDVPLIEDAAQAFGALPGVTGLSACYSFNLNKIVTTFGGGAVVSDDLDVLDHVRHLSTQARRLTGWEHTAVGYNYRINLLGAGLALGQIGRLRQTIEKKRELSMLRYAGAFADMPEIKVIGGGNWWLTAILVPALLRDEILVELRKLGIAARPMFKPLHQMAIFADCPRAADMSCSEDIGARGICLPSTVLP